MQPYRVALVTASSAGLGAATAKGLARAGFVTVINYNSSRGKAESLVSEINKIYGTLTKATPNNVGALSCHAIKADMSKKNEIYELVKQVKDQYGRLDCVVSNQGWTEMRRFDDIDDNVLEDDWDRCYDMNVKSHLFLFHAAKPYLAEAHGSFVTIASLAGVIPSGSSIPYAVSKAAQIHLVKTLAKIAAPEIIVNSISPGILLTEWGQKFPQEKLTTAKDKSVLKRLADIEDVVTQIVYLAQQRSMTGQNLVIDAGWSSG